MDLDVLLKYTHSMHGSAIIIFWQVHDLLVSVVKLGGKGLIYPEHHFLRIKMGFHPRAFF